MVVSEAKASMNATSHFDLLIHVILGFVPSLSGEFARIARLHLAPLTLIKRVVCILSWFHDLKSTKSIK